MKLSRVGVGKAFYVKGSLTPRYLIGTDKIYVAYWLNGNLKIDLIKNIERIIDVGI